MLTHSERLALIRLATVAASGRGAVVGELLTQLARALAEVPADDTVESGRCAGCGAVLPAPGSRGGRPRRWCTEPACQSIRKTGAKRRMGV
jgi:hypothetical protein